MWFFLFSCATNSQSTFENYFNKYFFKATFLPPTKLSSHFHSKLPTFSQLNSLIHYKTSQQKFCPNHKKIIINYFRPATQIVIWFDRRHIEALGETLESVYHVALLPDEKANFFQLQHVLWAKYGELSRTRKEVNFFLVFVGYGACLLICQFFHNQPLIFLKTLWETIRKLHFYQELSSSTAKK